MVSSLVAAALMGGAEGAAIASAIASRRRRRERRATLFGASVGAASLAVGAAIARVRQRPNEILAIWYRISFTSAFAAPFGWVAERFTGPRSHSTIAAGVERTARPQDARSGAAMVRGNSAGHHRLIER
jgi:hypothetical protein